MSFSYASVAFLALVATGALLTREELELPRIIVGVHRIAPYVAVGLSATTLALLIGRAS